MSWCHDHLCIPTYATICHPSMPPRDSLGLSSVYRSFMLPCLHYTWAPGDSSNHYRIFALWLVTIHVCLFLYWALPYKCLSKVCYVHVVLSTLYQEKMVTEQELEDLKPAIQPWDRLAQIQCTKPPAVVKKTADLLDEVGRKKEGNCLKGQWV